MKTRFLSSFLLLFAALGVPPLQACRADAPAQMMRALAAKYQASAVTLSLVVKIGAGGAESQTEMESGGVLLDSSGLVVTTNTGIDPMAAYAQEAEQYGSALTTRVVGVKILLAGGTEIPAKVVLRDKDKNLAFVRPLKKPGVKLSGISFDTAAVAALGDPVYLLGRQGKTAGRALQARVERVASVMDKPHRFYVLGETNSSAVGFVAFNEKGQPLGLLTLRFPIGKARYSESNLPVIIPARDVLEVARQAPQAKDVREGRSTPGAGPAKPAPKS
jgi:S1-C subfamily serine protease